eukprot:1468882-Amphidinium_carterae.1
MSGTAQSVKLSWFVAKAVNQPARVHHAEGNRTGICIETLALDNRATGDHLKVLEHCMNVLQTIMAWQS